MFLYKKALTVLALLGLLLSIGLATAQAEPVAASVTASAAYQSSPPYLRLPAPGAVITTPRPTFSWFPFVFATRYRLQVATDYRMQNLVADVWTSRTTVAPVVLMAAGNYYWRVEARDAIGSWYSLSETWSFEYILMQSPRPNTDTHTFTPRFTWNAHPNASRYLLEIESRRPYSGLKLSCVYSQFTLSAEPCDGVKLPYGLYNWRVLVDTGKGFSYPMFPFYWSLTINPKTLAPGPTGLGPSGVLTFDSESEGDEIVVSFSSVPNAETYEIEFSDNAFFNSRVTRVFTGPGDYDIIITPTNRVYWRVRAWLPGNITTRWSQTAWYEIRLV
ncbi:MAG: hypothetical protein HZC41_12830 [Chloroflexi bacterium]|nr:hypothetical protein [Chloroflexota bacterium]